MNKLFTSINGKFIPFEQSTVHVSDLIVQRGYGIFDFFLVRDKVPAYLSDHLDRFIKSAGLMGLDLAFTKAELADLVKSLIEKNNLVNSSIKILLTGGVSVDDFTLAPANSTLIVINKPFELKIPEAWKAGAMLLTSKYQRELPEAKTINYLHSVGLSGQLTAKGVAEVLYLDRNWVRECSRSNIFFVKDNRVFTPKSRVLAGVTRKRILALEGYDIQVKDFKIDELLSADEVFITSTTKGVLPIVKIDSHFISTGKVGRVTKALQKTIMPQ